MECSLLGRNDERLLLSIDRGATAEPSRTALQRPDSNKNDRTFSTKTINTPHTGHTGQTVLKETHQELPRDRGFCACTLGRRGRVKFVSNNSRVPRTDIPPQVGGTQPADASKQNFQISNIKHRDILLVVQNGVPVTQPKLATPARDPNQAACPN